MIYHEAVNQIMNIEEMNDVPKYETDIRKDIARRLLVSEDEYEDFFHNSYPKNISLQEAEVRENESFTKMWIEIIISFSEGF